MRTCLKRNGNHVIFMLSLILLACSGNGNGGGQQPWTPSLYLTANDGISGFSLYGSDGSAEGTRLIRDIDLLSPNSVITEMVDMNGIRYFLIGDWNTPYYALWRTDGTFDGTNQVYSSFSYAKYLVVMGNSLYFAADGGAHGRELWSSDGTTGGTKIVKDIEPGVGPSEPSELTVAGSVIYFRARELANGYGEELWKSDGTDVGTVMVKDIHPVVGSAPFNLTAVGNTLFFVADDGTHDKELWKSDGTVAGTVLVKDIDPGAFSAFRDVSFIEYDRMVSVDGMLYFGADDGVHGMELWKSNGTEAGTVMVKDIEPGAGSSWASYLTIMSAKLYFVAYDSTNGAELRVSDGTEAGTSLVKDISPGAASGNFYRPVVADNVTYFWVDDGIHGREIWKSDGTTAGTVLLKDVNEGIDSSGPGQIIVAGRMVYFTAFDSAHGFELWASNGVESGTSMVVDLHPGANDGVRNIWQ